MRIAYGKLGRSIPLSLDDASNVGGDIEVVRLLKHLVNRGHEVHLVGRNQSKELYPLANLVDKQLVNQWGVGGVFDNPPPASRHKDAEFEVYRQHLNGGLQRLPKFDAWLFWLGQHGSSLHPVPAVQDGKKGTYTNPMVSDLNYGFPLVEMVNQLGVRPIWLCPDPRNMIKFRDLWDPNQREVLAQFNTSKDNTFYHEPEDRLRSGGTRYRYSGIELLAAPPTDGWHPRVEEAPSHLFGLLVNEGYNNLGTKGRLHQISMWTKGLDQYEIFGTWSEASQSKLGRVIASVPLKDVTDTLRRWRATMTFPATGGGWATSKPWECFKAGVVCFKHPDYDGQGHIYGKHMAQDLKDFLCPQTMFGFRERLNELKDDGFWASIIEQQYEYFLASQDRLKGGSAWVDTALSVVASEQGTMPLTMPKDEPLTVHVDII